MKPRLLDPRRAVGVEFGRAQRLDLDLERREIVADRAAPAGDGDPFAASRPVNTPPLSAQ